MAQGIKQEDEALEGRIKLWPRSRCCYCCRWRPQVLHVVAPPTRNTRPLHLKRGKLRFCNRNSKRNRNRNRKHV